MLEFVDSDLYFVQDKKKVPDPAGQKSPDPDPHP